MRLRRGEERRGRRPVSTYIEASHVHRRSVGGAGVAEGVGMKSSPSAVIGLIIVLLLVFAAIFADVLTSRRRFGGPAPG